MKIRAVVLGFVLAGAACAQPIQVGVSNFSVDLRGDPDNRVATWGTAAAEAWTMTFRPPEGHGVEIRGVAGDLVSWPTEMGTTPATVPEGRFAGVLFGLGSSSSGHGSTKADFFDEHTFLYIQDVVDQSGSRTRFNQEYEACSVFLNEDHKLIVKVAVWLNDTGRMIHMEPTFTLQYRFIRKEQCQSRFLRSN